MNSFWFWLKNIIENKWFMLAALVILIVLEEIFSGYIARPASGATTEVLQQKAEGTNVDGMGNTEFKIKCQLDHYQLKIRMGNNGQTYLCVDTNTGRTVYWKHNEMGWKGQ